MTKIKINKKKINVKNNLTKVYPKLENLTVIPSSVQQTFNHPDSYGYDNVVVKAVESETLNIIPKEEEQSFSGLYSNVNVDKINVEQKIANLDFSNNEVIEIIPSENNYLNKVIINKDENLLPENIKNNVNVFGIKGTGSMLDLEINDCAYLFYDGHKVDQLSDILDLCKNVTTTEYMFGYGIKNQMSGTIDLRKLDMSKVTNAKNMFYASTSLTSIIGIEQFNVSKVKDMSDMFARCQNLTSLDLNDWDTSNVENFYEMFTSCQNLSNLNISNLNVSKSTNFYGMFGYCNGLISLDLSNWSICTTSNVQMARMFRSCTNLTNLDINAWDMSKVIQIQDMFKNNTNLTNLNFGNNLGKGYYTLKQSNDSYAKLDLSTCTNLTHDSLMSVINKLYDLNLTYDVANGGTLYTQQLVIGSTNMAKLTADEIAIATNKGWTVS